MPRSRLQPRLPDPVEQFRAVPRRARQLELGAPIPTFRAKQDAEITTVANGTFTEVHFDIWENGDERIFEAEEVGGGDTNLRIVRLKQRGWYIVAFAMGWDTDFNGDVGLDIADGWELSQAWWYTRHSGRTNSDMPKAYPVCYPPFWPTVASPTGFPSYFANLLFQACNYSGIAQDSGLGTQIEIGYLGDMSVEEWTETI